MKVPREYDCFNTIKMMTGGAGSYPQWNHGREVEWGDSCADSQWSAVRVGVHVLGNTLHGFTQLQVSDSTAVLDNLYRK